MYIDTHSHLDAPEFADDLEAVIQRAKDTQVETILIPATNLESLDRIEQICSQHPGYLYPMIGLHPEDVGDDYQHQLDQMHQRLSHTPDRYVAIGEIGLDLYWSDTYATQQVDAFEQQIGWAIQYHKPLMIHARNAHRQLIEIMERHRADNLSGVFHCFTGTTDEALQLLSYPNFKLGIGGVLTFKKSTLPEVLRQAVPLSRIVLETDSPYLAPTPHRGKRNESAFIRARATHLTAIYGLKTENIALETKKNAFFLFR